MKAYIKAQLIELKSYINNIILLSCQERMRLKNG